MQQLHATTGAATTQLPDGRWLISGGTQEGEVSGSLGILPLGAASTAVAADAGLHLVWARTGHTATVLPDGSIFVFGGTSADGTVLSNAEIVSLAMGSVYSIDTHGLIPRSEQTATLLTDGRVLIAGGIDADGNAIGNAQLWDPQTNSVALIAPSLMTPRFDHQSTLLGGGQDLLSGGHDATAARTLPAESFDPNTQLFGPALVLNPNVATSVAAIAETVPADGAPDVAVTSRLAIRFDEPMRIDQLTAQTITLVGPNGAVDGSVVGAEGGMLAFFTPTIDLAPGTTYTLFVRAVSDVSAVSVPFSSFRFTTHAFTVQAENSSSQPSVAENIPPMTSGRSPVNSLPSKVATKSVAKAALATAAPKVNAKPAAQSSEISEDWLPQEQNRHGHWRVLGLTGDPSLDIASLTTADLVASAGQTALAGRVLRLNGKPLAGVIVAAGTQSTVSDGQGRFLLTGLSAGNQIVKIDGTAVISNGRHYTLHYVQVQLLPGTTTRMPNTIYLPRVDPAQEVTISSPADREIVLTHPAIPGLEVHIPKGAVIRNYDGSIVTKVSITPIPVDRPPYPTPVDFYAYFTLQPGGAYVDGPPANAIRVIYPNYLGYAPGSRMNFYNYDPKSGGWGVYGQGLVNQAGTQVTPDASVVFRQLMSFGIGISTASNPPASGPPAGNCTAAGDPVDCFTGLLINTETDMTVRDVVPISVTRTYRPNDSVSRSFGMGNSLSYAMNLYTPPGSSFPYPDIYLILPDGGRVHYALQSSSNPTWMNVDSPSSFYGSLLTRQLSPEQWNLALPDHSRMVFYRDPPNQLESITDRNGNTVQINSGGGAGGNITQVISPSGRTISFAYDSSNRISSATDNLGNQVGYTYNAPNCATCLYQVKDQNGHTEIYNYDTSSRLNTITDKRGTVVVTVNYNPNNQVSKETLADGLFWQFSYGTSSSGAPQTTITDPNGNVTQDTFNSSGYLTQQVLAMILTEQQTWQYTRGTSQLVTAVLDPLGRTTGLGYDTSGNLTSLVKLKGTSQSVTYGFTYDTTFHQLTRLTDPNSNSTSLGYDSLGNLTSITDALGDKWTVTPSANGLPSAVKDPLSHAVQLGYLGNDLSSITDALGRTTNVFTDELGRLSSVTDALGNLTQFAFDPRNQLTGITDPTNGFTNLQYDFNGNLTSLTDPRAAGSHLYGYDANNRVNAYTDPSGNSESYHYDDVGNLLTKIDRKGQKTTTQYDGINRPHIITYQDGSTITITWDAGNRPTSFADTANGTITRQYDQLDRLTQETGPQGTVNYTQYDAAGRLIQMSVVGQANAIVYGYDNANRLRSITQGSNVVSLTPDSANRPGSVTLPNGIVGTYTFDNANELTGLSYALGSTVVGSLSYSYDAAGRRISATGSLAGYTPPSAITMTFDASNRMTAYGGAVPAYDLNGSMIGFGNTSYTWNARNQLVATSAGSSTFAYDALGRRVGTTIAGASTSYLYSGLNAVVAGGAQMLDGFGLDEIYASTTSGATSSYLMDGVNSTAALTSGSGAVTNSYTYSPYGDSAGGGATPFQFTGRENDGATGLYYYRARYYLPQTDRFISQDPLQVAAGTNFYAYANGNPVSLIDPRGLATVVVVGAPSGGNPFGHVAIATTGSGIYSYGTGTDPGTSIIDYLQVQASYRDSAAYILNTTAAQEADILQQLKAFPLSLPHVPGPSSHDTCATRTNQALNKGGINLFPFGIDPFSYLPAESALIARAYISANGGSIISIPQGATSFPSALSQFNPL